MRLRSNQNPLVAQVLGAVEAEPFRSSQYYSDILGIRRQTVLRELQRLYKFGQVDHRPGKGRGELLWAVPELIDDPEELSTGGQFKHVWHHEWVAPESIPKLRSVFDLITSTL